MTERPFPKFPDVFPALMIRSRAPEHEWHRQQCLLPANSRYPSGILQPSTIHDYELPPVLCASRCQHKPDFQIVEVALRENAVMLKAPDNDPGRYSQPFGKMVDSALVFGATFDKFLILARRDENIRSKTIRLFFLPVINRIGFQENIPLPM